MTTAELQQWLSAHGQVLLADNVCGPQTRAAIVSAFTATCPPAITPADIDALAHRLSCTAKQIRAVAKVESGGSAFDKEGRPKMLFERHLFARLTQNRFGLTIYSNPQGGGYNMDSWAKLALAACKDVDAAFSSASWGRFQVLGSHWNELGYPSPLELAYSTVTGEAAHYELFARFLEKNGLVKALRALSINAADNVAFAKGFNGPRFKDFHYDTKLAEAMA